MAPRSLERAERGAPGQWPWGLYVPVETLSSGARVQDQRRPTPAREGTRDPGGGSASSPKAVERGNHAGRRRGGWGEAWWGQGALRACGRAELGRGAERCPSVISAASWTPGRRAPVCCLGRDCGARRRRAPATAPLPAPRSVPPSVPPPAPLPPSAAAARCSRRTRSPAGTARQSGRPWVRVRELSRAREPELACGSGRRQGSPGRPPAPCRLDSRLGPAGSPGDEAAARPTPRRGRRDGNLRWELCAPQPRQAPPSPDRPPRLQTRARGPFGAPRRRPQNLPRSVTGATEDLGAPAGRAWSALATVTVRAQRVFFPRVVTRVRSAGPSPPR